jgi:Putative Actinobacterial Holin-X, holin superfamily III
LAQTVSEQAVALVRQEVGRARRELTAKAREASTGTAMVAGGALLGTLAAGTGTAALVLALSRRPEPTAAALGVTGLYAGAGALLARQGLVRLRAAAPPVPEQTVRSVKKDLASKKKPARASQAGVRRTANRTTKVASAARTKKP